MRSAYNYAEYLTERRSMMQEYADYFSGLKEKAKREQVVATDGLPEFA
ncbi:MAG: hypothetical protein LBS77_01845 [Desulfovibrio sp.]|nr:hypothetical protein [Desulfovibrio sp.]